MSSTGLVTCVSEGSATITAKVDNGAGTNVTGTLSVASAPVLVPDVPTVIANIPSADVQVLTVVVPAGTASLSINGSGGGSAGDPDLYVFAPGVTPSALNKSPNSFADSNRTAVSAESSGTESVTITNPAAGTWRVIVYAWSGGGAVTGYSVTASKTP